MNASASLGPPEVLTALGASSLLHEHSDVVDPRDVRAVLGVPLERTVEPLAFVTPEDFSRVGVRQYPLGVQGRPPGPPSSTVCIDPGVWCAPDVVALANV
ncbi:hypothetical protein [Streptomyces collinus]|uniref:hypothetical protein n=1 Tax=Streptomyces collinus TaxID=42684 RepID=UPI0033CBB257